MLHPLNNNHDAAADFFRARLGASTWVITPLVPLESDWPALEEFADCTHRERISVLIDSAKKTGRPAIAQVGDGRTLVVAWFEVDSIPQVVISFQRGPADILRALLNCASEAWQLHCQVTDCRLALDESAMQLVQSFEEQNWLRSLARGETRLSRIDSANQVAKVILRSLSYLLRSQDLFLLVEPEETERCGLVSAKYGDSSFSIQSIRDVIEASGISRLAMPWVKNNIAIQTPDGCLSSIIVVAVGTDEPLGYLAAINRLGAHEAGLPVYDPEFGSAEVGLLEEAGVLLSTQTHNIHLLIQSNQLFLGTLRAMSSSIDARDQYTQGHSERVAALAFALATKLELSEAACHEIYLSGILHDIGKIGIPDHVLLKEDALSDEEFRIIQQHPEIGYRILERLEHLQFVLPGVLYHHERWDGRGYPHGLCGTSIPLMARILAVADAFDAMTSSRPYRHAMPLEKAANIIFEGAGEQWDADVVACFRAWLTERIAKTTPPVTASQLFVPLSSHVDALSQAVMTLCR